MKPIEPTEIVKQSDKHGLDHASNPTMGGGGAPCNPIDTFCK
jgi:hypothetical protein